MPKMKTMETIKVARIENSNVTRRYLTFTHNPPLRVGKDVTVCDDRLEVSGRIIQADWKGVHTLDTAPTK